jgi:hypothetical protein
MLNLPIEKPKGSAQMRWYPALHGELAQMIAAVAAASNTSPLIDSVCRYFCAGSTTVRVI